MLIADVCTWLLGIKFTHGLEDTGELNFKHSCFSLPDFSEFCIHENVCWAENKFLIPKGAYHKAEGLHVPNDEVDSYQNLPAHGSGKVHERRSNLLPRRSFLQLNLSAITVESFSAAKHVDLGFLTGFDSNNENIFHFAESTLLFHAVRQMNGTFVETLPPLSLAMLAFERPPLYNWIDSFSKFLFGSQTPIMWSDSMAALSKDRPICFRKLIVSGTIIHLTTGIRDAEALREHAFKALAIAEPRRREIQPVIVVENRSHRSWTNRDEILDVI